MRSWRTHSQDNSKAQSSSIAVRARRRPLTAWKLAPEPLLVTKVSREHLLHCQLLTAHTHAHVLDPALLLSRRLLWAHNVKSNPPA